MDTKTLDLRALGNAERDAKVNEAVAKHICGWPDDLIKKYKVDFGWSDNHWARSTNAVLPYLEKHSWWEICQDRNVAKPYKAFWCSIFYSKPGMEDFDAHVGRGDTAPEAACLALLRANGIEVLV